VIEGIGHRMLFMSTRLDVFSRWSILSLDVRVTEILIYCRRILASVAGFCQVAGF
jgi:hypothetical protein